MTKQTTLRQNLVNHLHELPAEQIKQAIITWLKTDNADAIECLIPDSVKSAFYTEYLAFFEDTFKNPEFLEILARAKPASDLSEHGGTLTLGEEPLSFQHRIRDEW